MSDSCDPMDCSLPGSSVHGISSARKLEWICHFLLQGIFLTQESNLGLLQCRQFLYRLSWGNMKHMRSFSRGMTDSHPCFLKTTVAPCQENKIKGAWLEEEASQLVLAAKNLPVSAGEVRDAGSIPGSGRSPGGGHGNPLQYSCLENPRDRGAWQATVHRVLKSQTQVKGLSTHTRFGRGESSCGTFDEDPSPGPCRVVRWLPGQPPSQSTAHRPAGWSLFARLRYSKTERELPASWVPWADS